MAASLEAPTTGRHLFFLKLLILSAFPTLCIADYNLNPPESPIAARNSIPRSTHSSHYQRLRQAATSYDQDSDSSSHGESSSQQQQGLLDRLLDRPPWNPSPHIDASGFLLDDYARIPGDWEREVKLGGRHQYTKTLTKVKVRIRQVPGDGNCLFHSISTCMAYEVNGTHVDFSTHAGLNWLYHHSAKLRRQAVECLRQRKVMFLQGREYLRARDLVDAAAAQYGISAAQYCDLMQQDSYWGGGPEIVALCNVFKRPIHVYELASSTNGATFVLRRMACFGSPKFDGKPPFHILSADSRFPDVSPGRQLPAGNHFLAVFPLDQDVGHRSDDKLRKRKKRKLVRGGGDADDRTRVAGSTWTHPKRRNLFGPSLLDDEDLQTAASSDDDESLVDAEMDSTRASLKAWWKRFFLLNKSHQDE